jgi:osmotically-inducible protein OsmY
VGSTSPADARLADRVYVRVTERVPAARDVRVSARGSTVALAGSVPGEEACERVVRIARSTPGVDRVRDQLEIGASPRADRVDDGTLARQVAHAIADAMPGTNAGPDWWFSGWRVEGPDDVWSFTVEADDGVVLMSGDLPRRALVRQAVTSAAEVPGVRSIRSDYRVEETELDLPPGSGVSAAAGSQPFSRWSRENQPSSPSPCDRTPRCAPGTG